jgi:NAD(P)-dependent dehydrogenase (short-subunit alcohol dehydrogenase family)
MYLFAFIQVAIVTGGGQGVGEGIAKMLSDNGAAKVVIFDINEEKGQAVAESLCNGLFCKVDVSSEDSVKSGFEMVRATCGRLDIMVNCAGIMRAGKKTEDIETTSFDRVYEGIGKTLSGMQEG